MLELLMTILGTALLTIALGFVTTWPLVTCLTVAVFAVALGAMIIFYSKD